MITSRCADGSNQYETQGCAQTDKAAYSEGKYASISSRILPAQQDARDRRGLWRARKIDLFYQGTGGTASIIIV
jgi:hypothetical protein